MDSNAKHQATRVAEESRGLPWQLVFLLIVIGVGVLGLIARAVGLF